MSKTKSTTLTPVLVTTAHRGVFAGLIPADQDLAAKAMPLKSAKMAIYWGTTKGVMELAETGPTHKSKISAAADAAAYATADAAADEEQQRIICRWLSANPPSPQIEEAA